MNIIDLRKKLLQSSTEMRVCSDRRKVSYQFGSPEWLEYLKNNHIECPTEDRRKMIKQRTDELSIGVEPIDDKTTYQRIFLTPGERKLLQDIYLSDFDDSSDL